MIRAGLLALVLTACWLPATVAKPLFKSHLRRRLADDPAPVNGDFMWGICDEWSANTTGCNMANNLQCNSNLSSGPADFDLELNITALPPSTPTQDMHLQWWAARRSPSPYMAMWSPQGCGVYRDVRDAYPHHSDADFNGGNVRISENGTATIRVSSPSTYVVDHWVVHPHIHLRLCSGLNFAQWNPDTIFFNYGGPVLLKGFHGQSHAPMINGTWSPNPSTGTQTSTTAEASAWEGSGTNDGVLLSNTSDFDDLRISDAKETLDLDALEFSPVYQCLLDGKLFSYRSSGCVDECPADMEVVVGQCVLPEKPGVPAELEASWRLELACGEHCWHDKFNVTLHHVRLSVGDLLEIPFQDVQKASLVISEQLSSRRLSAAATHAAILHVTVLSKRVGPGGASKLQGLIPEKSSAGWLLGFDVYDVRVLTDGSTIEGTGTTLTDSSDPYAGAYEKAAAGNRRTGLGAGSPLDFVPVELLIAGACAVVVLGIAGAGYLELRRRRRCRASDAFPGQMPVVTGRPIEKGADEDDWPAKPSTVGAPFDSGYPEKPAQTGGVLATD